MNRRKFLSSTLAGTGGVLITSRQGFPAIIRPDDARPIITGGVQTGDVTSQSAIVWARADRPARMIVEYASSDAFRNPRRVLGPAALEPSDFTARVDLTGLPAGEQIFYRVNFESLADRKVLSEPAQGTFRTAPLSKRDVLATWGGDVVGQGWGINPDFGGMKIFETMRRLNPDVFIHSGDTIYADGPLQAEVKLDSGGVWRNLVTPEKSKVAETLDEFRGCHRYNLMDANLRRFNAEVPVLAQWDDHEVRNNWYPGQVLDDARYTVKSVDLLAARAKRAFLDYLPLRLNPLDAERVYRAFPYGPSLEVVMLDERSYRGPNTSNRQSISSAETDFLGTAQMRWLKQRLLSTNATWKLIASDMPIGLIVKDGSAAFENASNGDGPALGRELEIAELLSFIKRNSIRNVVWITADVHYAAAYHYDPARAQFQDFDPFWEFVAGPLNAGTFRPSELDNTFGPQEKFVSVDRAMMPNRSPSAGLQFFGAIRIDGKSEVMTVTIHNLAGEKIYSVDLQPVT
ncbi:MAG: alkaline phosphatase D family protein [Acidobacteriota bacterium]